MRKFTCRLSCALILMTMLLGGFALPGTAMAQEKPGVTEEEVTGARNFIDNMGQRAIAFLSDDSLSQQEQQEEFKDLLEDSFAMKTIGRFALGTYWRVASSEQRQEYLDLFKNMVVRVYSRRFSDYEGQDFKVSGAHPRGRRDVQVTSFIIPDNNDPKVQVDWLVRYKDGRYKIVDVVVEGVSMSITQRSDFSSIIQRGGGRIEVLLKHLRSQGEDSRGADGSRG